MLCYGTLYLVNQDLNWINLLELILFVIQALTNPMLGLLTLGSVSVDTVGTWEPLKVGCSFQSAGKSSQIM